jgi:hypothetical protein
VAQGCIKPYRDAADQHMQLLRNYERASQDTILVKQGNEGKDFWEAFGLKPNQASYALIGEWNHLFIDVSMDLIKCNVVGG